jgi:hypothetical protein
VTTRFTDYHEYSLDVQPSDWLAYGVYNGNWKVRAKAGMSGDNCLEFVHGSISGDGFSYWDAVADTADLDLVTKVRFNSAPGGTTFSGIVARYALATGYHLRVGFTSTGISLIRKTSSATTLASYAFTPEVNTLYYLRFNLVGTALKARVWRFDEAEPIGVWHISTTSPTVTAAGKVGFLSQATTHTSDYDLIGIGTDGDPAPTAPLGTPRVLLLHTEQRVSNDRTLLAHTEQRVYNERTLLAHTEQRVTNDRVLLLHTEQRVYNPTRLRSAVMEILSRNTSIEAISRDVSVNVLSRNCTIDVQRRSVPIDVISRSATIEIL